jgi:hypothetical protein
MVDANYLVLHCDGSSELVKEQQHSGVLAVERAGQLLKEKPEAERIQLTYDVNGHPEIFTIKR